MATKQAVWASIHYLPLKLLAGHRPFGLAMSAKTLIAFQAVSLHYERKHFMWFPSSAGLTLAIRCTALAVFAVSA